MCDKVYQDNCYFGCKNWSHCSYHRLLVCDGCGKRLTPSDRIEYVEEVYHSCSSKCTDKILDILKSTPQIILLEGAIS